MENRKSLIFFIAISLFLISGCVGTQIERSVQDNLFTSSESPKIQIKINPDFKYLGKYEDTRSLLHATQGQSAEVKHITYLFCKIGNDKRIKKIITINFQDLQSPKYWLGDLFGKVSEQIDLGTRQITGKTYQWMLRSTNNPTTKEVNKALFDGGFRTHRCYLQKVIGRIANMDSSSKMYIGYAENVEDLMTSCHEWNKNLSLLSGEQAKRLNEFHYNNKKNLQIVGEHSPIQHIKKDRILIKTEENIETKLRKLKNLFEQGLINQEEYEKKKKGLLENF